MGSMKWWFTFICIKILLAKKFNDGRSKRFWFRGIQPFQLIPTGLWCVFQTWEFNYVLSYCLLYSLRMMCCSISQMARLLVYLTTAF